MSREHQSGTDSAVAGRADERAAHTPGKSTLIAGLESGGHEATARPHGLGTGSLPRLDLGDGQPLPDAQRTRFESSLGTDLSHVRVHSGEAAGKAADSVDARAYAVGQDIAFGPGQYKP